MGYIQVGNCIEIDKNCILRSYDNINYSFYKNRSVSNYGATDTFFYLSDNIEDGFVGFFSNTVALSLKETEAEIECKEYIVDRLLDEFNITENSITGILQENNAIVSEKVSVGRSVEQYFVEKFDIDLSTIQNIIQDKVPEYKECFNDIIHDTYILKSPCFIMSPETFKDFSTFALPILSGYLDTFGQDISQIDLSISDKIFSLLLDTFLNDQSNNKILVSKTINFVIPPPVKFNHNLADNEISIIMATNEKYVIAATTLIQSIYENSSPENQYNISILYNKINSLSIKTIFDMVESMGNVSVDFVNVEKLFKKNQLPIGGWFSYETYFRFAAMEVFSKVSKTLYIDVDMVVETDVAELFYTDVSGYLLAATRDADTAGIYNGYHKYRKDYTHQILKLDKPFDYFQAGIILFNLDEFRKSFTFTELLNLAASYPWKLFDQDVLNVVCKDKVLFLDMSWNVMVDTDGKRIPQIIRRAPLWLYSEYMEARKHPKVLHFAGGKKPWYYPEMDFGYRFWYYARKSICYEMIISRMISDRSSTIFVTKFSQSNKKIFRKIADKLLPKGSKRREVVKKIIKRK